MVKHSGLLGSGASLASPLGYCLSGVPVPVGLILLVPGGAVVSRTQLI